MLAVAARGWGGHTLVALNNRRSGVGMARWVLSFTALRAAMRLLAEQGDGLDITVAVRTATVRYDINGTAGLNPWEAVGTSTSSDGDSDPEDIDISSNVNGEFWLQLGIGVRKTAGAGSIGQGQAVRTCVKMTA